MLCCVNEEGVEMEEVDESLSLSQITTNSASNSIV